MGGHLVGGAGGRASPSMVATNGAEVVHTHPQLADLSAQVALPSLAIACRRHDRLAGSAMW